VTAGTTTIVSGVALEQRLAAQATAYPDGTGVRAGIDGSSDLRATILGASAAVGLDYAVNPAGTGLQVRHRLSVPLARSLVLRDEFRVGYVGLEPGSTHASSAVLSLGPAALAARWVSDQRANGRADWSIDAQATTDRGSDGDGPVLGVTAGASLAEERPARPTLAAYPVSWAHSFADLVPATSPDARDGEAAVAASAGIGRVEVEVAASSRFAADRSSGRRTAAAGIGLSAPFALGDASELVFSATRDVELTTAGAPGPAPGDDALTSARLLREHPLLFAYWPGEAIVSSRYPSRSEELTAGLLAAAYRPVASVEFTRRISSSPWSLLLPTSAGASLARPAEREQDAFASRYEAGVDATFVAPNLFGRLGSAPLFRFYDTDEFQSSVAVEWTDDGAQRETEVSYDGRVRLLWNLGASLSSQAVVTTLLGGDCDTRAAASLVWTRPVDGVPLPGRLESSVRSRERTTTLEIDYTARADSSIYGRLVHESALAIGDGGTIRVHGGLGLGSERVGDERFGLAGLRVGVEGELRR